MKIYLKRIGYSLQAADAETCDALDKIAQDEMVLCDIKQARSYPNHKRYFKFLELAYHAQNHFTEAEAFRRWLQMESGYFSTIVCPNGEVKFVADSISFEKMEESEFKKLFSTAIDVYLRECGSGLTESQIMQIIHFG